ncbi:MAG: DNA adenine methylase [Spirochaetia bacterium]
MKKRHSENPQACALPFLKWAGGKRGIIDQIRTRMPASIATYWEPFIGGGALFFATAPKNAVIGDKNAQLINTYQVVQHHLPQLIQILDIHAKEHCHDYYYSIRSTQIDAQDMIAMAARFIYLNKTCYNGLYRVNKKGQFNVPYGRYKKVNLYDKNQIQQCQNVLKNVKIFCGDFSEISPQKGDFVYFDPPYYETFTQYTHDSFGPNEQTRLRDFCKKLHESGVSFVLSNSHNDFIYDLYKDFQIDVIQAPRFISCQGQTRGKIQEVIISNV